MNQWISALIAVAGGLVIGSLAARIVRGWLSKEKRPDALRSAARPLATLVFSAFLIIGLVTALGFVNEEALDQLPKDLVDYIPRALSAGIVLILANVIGTLIGGILERSLGPLSPTVRDRAPGIARGAVLFAGVLIAGSQLGVDVTILTLAAASLFGAVSLSIALMVGLGTRDVTAQVAAGRVVRRIVSEGDQVRIGDRQGIVVSLHANSLEIGADDEHNVVIPYREFVEGSFELVRNEDSSEA